MLRPGQTLKASTALFHMYMFPIRLYMSSDQFNERGWNAAALNDVRQFLKAEAAAGVWVPSADLPAL